MKCIYCGKEVENGSEICPYCGMILSLGDDNAEVTVPEYTPNVFSSDRRREKLQEPARELEVSDVEESVPVVESIPEFAPAEYDFTPVTGVSQPAEETAVTSEEHFDETVAEEAVEEVTEEIAEEAVEETEEEAVEEAAEEIPEEAAEAAAEETAEEAADEEAEEMTEEVAAETPAVLAEVAIEEASDVNEAAEADGYSVAEAESVAEAQTEAEPEEMYEAPSYEDFSATEPLDADTDDVAYPEYADFAETDGEYENVENIVCVSEEDDEPQPEAAVVSAAGAAVNEANDDGDDIYVKPSKGKSGIITVAALIIVLVGLVVAGGYVVKNVLPEKQPTKPSVTVNADATTEQDTTEDEQTTLEDETMDASDETTEEETTAEETTVQDETTEDTTDVATTVPSTTVPSTTKPNTTKPNTTKPNTTKPNTTKPNTTKPNTTKPNTTKDPYGYSNVEIKAPKKYLSKTYKGYITPDSVTVRAYADSDAPKYFYLIRGSEVIVKAKENGFCYVYSTRFATHGWVAESYISDSRPIEDTTKTPSGTVKPDKNGSGETKYATNMLNVRKGPGTSYGITTVIPVGHPVKIVGYKSGVSGWAYVTDLTTGTNGWVSTAYLKS